MPSGKILVAQGGGPTAVINQSLVGAVFPAGLQKLTFGFFFNQEMEGAVLPPGLQELEFGNRFEQRLDGVVWPASLERVTLFYNDHFVEMQLAAARFPHGCTIHVRMQSGPVPTLFPPQCRVLWNDKVVQEPRGT